MKTKIITILVTAVLAISLLPVSAFAGEIYSEGYFYYTKGEGCIIITGYFGNDEEAIVPDNVAGYPVSVIAEGAFVGTKAKKVYLPATIMEIEIGAIAEGIEVLYKSAPDNTGGSTKTDGNAGTGNNSDGTDVNKENYQPLVQPERDENGNVAEGVNEGPEKIYVDKEGKLIEDPEEIKAIDAAQEAARQEKQPTEQTVSEPESEGTNIWIIAGIVIALMAAAGITYYSVHKSKKHDNRLTIKESQ